MSQGVTTVVKRGTVVALSLAAVLLMACGGEATGFPPAKDHAEPTATPSPASTPTLNPTATKDTQTLHWELYSYTLYVDAPLDWEWDAEYDQALTKALAEAGHGQPNVYIANTVRRELKWQWAEPRPRATISFVETPQPDFAIKKRALEQSGYHIELWADEVHGLPAMFEKRNFPSDYVYARDRAHRWLTAYIEAPGGGSWVVSCEADLVESKHIKDCETIVNSVRLEARIGGE